MEKVNINVRLVEDNRVNIANFGQLYGHRIYKATKVPCILDFNSRLRDVTENGGIITNRTPYRYKIVPIDIVGLNLEKDIDGSNIIIINKGMSDEDGNSVEIRCTLDNSKFTKEVTTQTITDALNKPDSNDMFFSQPRKLVETLNPANASEISRIEKLVDDLNKMKDMIKQTRDLNVSSVNDYFKQLDKENEKVKVNVTIDE